MRPPNLSEQSELQDLLASTFGARFRITSPGSDSVTFLAEDLAAGEHKVTEAELPECVANSVASAARSECQVSVRWLKGLTRGSRMKLEHDLAILRRAKCDCLPRLVASRINERSAVVVCEHDAGTLLSDRLLAGPLELIEAVEVAQAVFEALAKVHQLGGWHGDIRPARVLVMPPGSPQSAKLLHFGTAREGSTETVDQSVALERARYASSEQAGLSDDDCGPLADLYSAGAVLFTMLSGSAPFSGDTVGDVLRSHVTCPTPSLRAMGVAVPSVLDQLIQRLLQRDSANRYQTAEAVVADLRALGEALREGKHDPAIVIGSSDRRQSLTEPSFVGRQEERLAILDALHRAGRGEPTLVVLEGESGLGKSRLLSEMSQRAASNAFHVFRGQAATDIGNSALALLDGVVESFISLGRTDASTYDHLKDKLGAELDSLLAALPQLADALGVGDQRGSGPEDLVEARSLRGLCSFLHALGTPESPALVILDDCQWADELACKMLQRWQAEFATTGGLNHVLVLISYRSEEVPADHTLRSLSPSHHIRLSPLPDPDVRMLVESMAGHLPEPSLEFITGVAAGSPFMASAALRGLVESGALVRDGDAWRVEPLAMQEVQASTRSAGFLTTRLEFINEAALRLLSAGAVLGKEFDWDAAAYLNGQTADVATDALKEARERHLVWQRGDGLRYVFVHDKIRETLLSRLNEHQRRNMHERAAEYLLNSETPKPFEIAFHFDQAQLPERALPYSMAAAQEARDQHSLEIAQQQYQIAWRAAQHADGRIRYTIAEGLGDVLMLRGEYDAAEPMFREAAQFADSTMEEAQIVGKLAELFRKRGDMERAIQDFESALRILGYYVPRNSPTFGLLLLWEAVVQTFHTLLPRLLVHRLKRMPTEAEGLGLRLFSGLTHSYYYGRGKLMVLWAHVRGMNLGEKYLPTLELAQAYSTHAPVIALLTLFQRAFHYANKSYEIRKNLGDLWGQGQSLHYYGCALYAASRFEECIVKCREAVRLLERMGDYWQVHIARYQIAASYYHLGDFASAIEESRKNHESGLALGDEQAAGINLEIWARASAGAVPPEILAREVARHRSDPQATCQVNLAQAVCQLRDRDEDSAIATLQHAIQVARQAGVANAYTLPAFAWLVTALRQKAENDTSLTPDLRAATLRRAARAGRAAMRSTLLCKNDAPRILRERALVAAMRGHQRTAQRLLTRSLAAARLLKSQFEFALSLQAQARIGLEYDWPDAAQQLEEAQLLLGNVMAVSGVTLESSEDETPTLSLADRFDTLLQVGRDIIAAVSESQVYERSRAAALRLLRGEQCSVFVLLDDGRRSPILGGKETVVGEDILQAALDSGLAHAGTRKPVSQTDQQSQLAETSVLAVPIIVRGRTKACLHVTNSQVADLFGHVEQRLADFVAAIVGASLESVEVFDELRSLNETLEQRVAERTAAAESRAQQLAISNHNLECLTRELRATEEQLRVAIRKAEAASEAKSRFLAMMSHEIRTPMNGVLGMTELALKTNLTAQQAHCLKVVKNSGDALMVLLNDILDLSKIEAGRMEIEHIQFDLYAVVENSLSLFSSRAHKKRLELTARIEPTLPRHLIGDPNRLRQIISNLVGNAIKFTAKGEVVVNVEVDRADDQPRIRLDVTDTGIGIAEEKQELIFEEFRQSDCSTTREFGGTGLGLSITKSLVKLMQGDITVQSEPGVGSTFSCFLPLVTDPAATGEATPVPLPSAHVCLVSASDTSRRAYCELLEMFGLQVRVEESIERLTRESLDEFPLVIIDVPPGEMSDVKLPGQTTLIKMLVSDDVLEPDQNVVYKPVCRKAFYDLLSRVLGSTSADDPADLLEHDSTVDLTPCRILLADDSLANREVAGGLLELEGHEVVAVESGFEALEAFESGSFDLVLMDVEMPEMDGLEATSRIRDFEQRTGRRRTPILAMTAHVLPEIRDACRQRGMDGSIAKPIDPDDLFSQVRAATSGARQEPVSAR